MSRTPLRRSVRRLAVLGAVVGMAVVPAISSRAGASVTAARGQAKPPAITKRSIRLGPGLLLTVIRYPLQPNEVRILTVTPSLGPRLDVQPGREAYPIFVHPSTVAARMGDVAIVNAAFTAKGAPVHASLVDGELWTSGTETAQALALTPNGRRAFIGKPALSMHAQIQGGAGFRITNWNARLPKGSGISAYTSRGGKVTPPPGVASPSPQDPAWCAARLVPTNDIAWTGPLRVGITRTYKVEDQPDPCGQTHELIGPVRGSVVLEGRSGTVGGHLIRALTPNDTIHLTWSFTGWPGVTDVIGGEPLLVSAGHNVAPAPKPGDPYFFYKNPRTAAGVNAGCLDPNPATRCQITIVTVDGRRLVDHWSAGWLLRQLAAQLLRRGVVRAINFDGGGSTEMWVKAVGPYCRMRPATGGCLVDRPSDADGERATTVSLGVLPGSDPGEILPALGS
jgi:Phosphodiester glycosidase